MMKKGKRNPMVALSGMLHISVRAYSQQKISSSQLLQKSFLLVNITKVTDLLLCRKDFSLCVTVGTHTSLKSLSPYSNHSSSWHLCWI